MLVQDRRVSVWIPTLTVTTVTVLFQELGVEPGPAQILGLQTLRLISVSCACGCACGRAGGRVLLSVFPRCWARAKHLMMCHVLRLEELVQARSLSARLSTQHCAGAYSSVPLAWTAYYRCRACPERAPFQLGPFRSVTARWGNPAWLSLSRCS